MQHELKADLINFARLKDGSKTFDKRYNKDNQFQFGDTLKIREWDDSKINSVSDGENGFTDADPLYFKIGFIEADGTSSILSLIPTERPALQTQTHYVPKPKKSKTRKKSK